MDIKAAVWSFFFPHSIKKKSFSTKPVLKEVTWCWIRHAAPFSVRFHVERRHSHTGTPKKMYWKWHIWPSNVCNPVCKKLTRHTVSFFISIAENNQQWSLLNNPSSFPFGCLSKQKKKKKHTRITTWCKWDKAKPMSGVTNQRAPSWVWHLVYVTAMRRLCCCNAEFQTRRATELHCRSNISMHWKSCIRDNKNYTARLAVISQKWSLKILSCAFQQTKRKYYRCD